MPKRQLKADEVHVIGKNANGEGSIYQRKDGRWVAAVTDSDGKRHAFYGKTRAEAKSRRTEALTRRDKGQPVVDSKTSVGDFLVSWCAPGGGVEANDRSEATVALYRTICTKHLAVGALGRVTLDKVKPSHVNRELLALKRAGLSASYARSSYAVLKAAFEAAVDDRLIAENPVLSRTVKRPRRESKAARSLTIPELTALLHAAESSRYHDLIVFIYATGVRRNEALTTKWEHLDLANGLYAVPGTKTDASDATLPLSSGLVAMLQMRRDIQSLEREAAANQWHESGLVFTTETGTPVNGRNLLRVVKNAAKDAKIKNPEEVNVHSLRHTVGTYLESTGVPLKTTSTLLRHADIQTTANVYIHPEIESMRPAMTMLSDAIGL